MKTASFLKLNFILLSILPLLFSCEKWKCVEGSGKYIQESRVTPSFTGVVSEGSFEVYISIDSVFDVQVDAQESLLPYIITEVRSDDLIIKIKDDRCIKSRDAIIVDIRMPELEYAELAGSGFIYCNSLITSRLRLDLTGSGDMEFFNVHADYIDINHLGSGKIELTGSTVQSDIKLEGSGQVRANKLEQDVCDVYISGSGDVHVLVWDDLYAEISGSGWCYYWDIRPLRLTHKITGSGGIKAMLP